MPDAGAGSGLTLEQMLGETLLTLCSPETRQEVEAEVDLLLARYMGDEGPASLTAVADILDNPPEVPPSARLRLRLWAATLRRRTQRA